MQEVKGGGYHKQAKQYIVLSKQEKIIILFLLFAFVSVITYFSVQTFFSSEQGSKRYHIGYVKLDDVPANEENWQGFKSVIIDSGYQEDVDVFFSVSETHGNDEAFVSSVNALVNNEVDIVFVQGKKALELALSVSQDTPVLFSLIQYPREIEHDFDDEMNTAIGSRSWIDHGIQARILSEIFETGRILAITRPGNTESKNQYELLSQTLRAHSFSIDMIEVPQQQTEEEIEASIESADLIYLLCDELANISWRTEIISLLSAQDIPVVGCMPEDVRLGATLSITYDNRELGRIAGDQAIDLIRGRHIQDLRHEVMQIPKIHLNQERIDQLFIDIPLEIDSAADIYR